MDAIHVYVAMENPTTMAFSPFQSNKFMGIDSSEHYDDPSIFNKGDSRVFGFEHQL